jgi:Flp pilus assembly pilin Flp
MTKSMMALVRGVMVMGRFVGEIGRDESGQDLIEYALLTAIIAIAGILAFPVIAGKLGVLYVNWNVAAQAVWEPCPPGGCP